MGGIEGGNKNEIKNRSEEGNGIQAAKALALAKGCVCGRTNAQLA